MTVIHKENLLRIFRLVVIGALHAGSVTGIAHADGNEESTAELKRKIESWSTIYGQSEKDWMNEVKVDPTPVSDEVVEISISDTAVLYSPGWVRRDPSDIILVGDTYYCWYSKVGEGDPGYPGGWSATTWYATSKDGFDWEEQGIAIDKGSSGAWDEGGVYTPNILVYKGKYYLAYTGVKAPFNLKYNQPAIGLAVADSPDGPWSKVGGSPIVPPTDSLEAPDGFLCDDTVFVVKDEKIWLYYKGYPKGLDEKGKAVRVRGGTFLLVAVADQPEGPYVKHGKILHRGHEAVVWKNADGSVGSLCTRDGPSRYYESSDGFTFTSMNPITPQKAVGVYRADFGEGNSGCKPTWGISASRGLKRIEIKWP